MAPPKLTALPPGFAENREAAHRLAVHVVYRPLFAAEERFDLTWAPGGFGTPLFGQREQIRVSGEEIIHQKAGQVSVEYLSSLRAAAVQLGIDLDEPVEHPFEYVVPAGDLDEQLAVDLDAMDALAVLFEFSNGALGECRHAWKPLKPSKTHLNPEHFTLQFEVIDPYNPETEMTFGVSAGSEFLDIPYFFVTIDEDRRRPVPNKPDYWNAPFGAMLPYNSMPVNPDDQRPKVVEFLQAGLIALAPPKS